MSKQFCLNGHDTYETGRIPNNGQCRQCHRNEQKRIRRGLAKRRVEDRFPAAPLRERVRKEALKYRTGWESNGIGALGRLYADRFELTREEGDDAIRSLVNKDYKTVTEDKADRFCVLLGIHPTELWPEEWPLAEVDV